MNIENILDYIKECPYLKHKEIHNDYLVNKVTAYSVNEAASYDPIVKKDIVGNEYCQFLFNFDSKFYWNEEIQNNLNNSQFCNNFSSWIKQQNKIKNFPKEDGIEITSISTTSNGYIFDTNADEAVYRISLKIEYWRNYENN